jgi:hypothetical protein
VEKGERAASVIKAARNRIIKQEREMPSFYSVWASADFFRPMMIRIMLSDLEFCRFGKKFDPDSDEMMKRIDEMGGSMLYGHLEKEDSHGIWLWRDLGKSKMKVMIPWKFIHAALGGGSAAQMKKFGFDDREAVPEVEDIIREDPAG